MRVWACLVLGGLFACACASTCGPGTVLNEALDQCEVYNPDTSTPQIDVIDEQMVFITRSGQRIGMYDASASCAEDASLCV